MKSQGRELPEKGLKHFRIKSGMCNCSMVDSKTWRIEFHKCPNKIYSFISFGNGKFSTFFIKCVFCGE